jgi:hypothetical protein
MIRAAAALLFALVPCVASAAGASLAVGIGPASDVTLFRVFLTDGSSLVSYGELARVGDRVVFSMPTTASHSDAQLHLVNLPADRVDWGRTTRYAESVRGSQYLAGRAALDYAALTNQVAQTLDLVARTSDPGARVALVENARKVLAAWPASHFYYKQADVAQMLMMLDEAIADLRAAAGADRFTLNFIAGSAALPPAEPLLPPPTPQEAIAQVLLAGRFTDIPADRITLLTIAVDRLGRDAARLPPDWAASSAAAARAELAREIETERSYRTLSERMLRLAEGRAREADVRGVQRLIDEARERDAALGAARPDIVGALMESLDARLEATRRLRLARDQWELRVPALRAYRAALSLTLARFARLKPALEDIQLLAGSTADTLLTMQRLARQLQRAVGAIEPPPELQIAHSLLMSSASLAENAAGIRREAALAANMTRAWDASAAAAGSLMLAAQARADIQSALRLPQLPK